MRSLHRRTFLKGAGAAMALPMFEAMLPRAAVAAGASTSPTRMAFVFFPNGAIMPDWKPTGEGAQFELSKTLSPLAPHKDDLLVISGLAHDKARANGDGAGDHARCSAAFLTGTQPRKTDGADIQTGPVGRSGGRRTDRQPHAIAVARTGPRSGPTGGKLRLRLQLCLRLQHLVEVGHDADGQRDRPALRLRASFRLQLQRRESAGRAQLLPQEHPRLRCRRRLPAAHSVRCDRPSQDGRVFPERPRDRTADRPECSRAGRRADPCR